MPDTFERDKVIDEIIKLRGIQTRYAHGARQNLMEYTDQELAQQLGDILANRTTYDQCWRKDVAIAGRLSPKQPEIK